MIIWQASQPFLVKEVQENKLLHNLKIELPTPEESAYYSCPITNSGYDGLHVFIWGACKDSPNWKIDPYFPELMGCNWMARNYPHDKLNDIAEMLEDLYNQSFYIGESLDVPLKDLIMLAHENEIIEHYIKPLTGNHEVEAAPRLEIYRFNINEQVKRIQLIWEFVNLCRKYNADIKWSSIL